MDRYQNKNLKNFAEQIMVFMLFFPRFKPMCIEYMPELNFVNSLYTLMQIVSIGISVLMYLGYMIQKKITKNNFSFLFAVVLYFLTFIISSLINNQLNLLNSLGSIASIVSFVMLIQITYIRYGKGIISLVSHFLQLLIFINSVIHYFKPYGLAQSSYYGNYIHFLANRNGLILIYLTTISMMVTDYYLRDNGFSIKRKLWVTVIALTVIPFKSGTAILCVAGLLIVIFVGDRIVKLFSYARVWGMYAIVTIIMVFMRITEQFEFIFNLVGKDATLTGRTIIWKSAQDMITATPKSVIFGYGATLSNAIYYNGRFFSSHNMILEMLLRGGIIAFLMYIIVIISCRKVKLQENSVNDQYSCYMNVILLFALAASLTEPNVFTPYIFIIMTLINISADLVKGNDAEKNLCQTNANLP